MTREISISGQIISQPTESFLLGTDTPCLEFYFLFSSPFGKTENPEDSLMQDIKVTVSGKQYEKLIEWKIAETWNEFNKDPENPKPMYVYIEGYLFSEKTDPTDKLGTLTIRTKRIERYTPTSPIINRLSFAGSFVKDAEIAESKREGSEPPAKTRVVSGSNDYSVFINLEIWGRRGQTAIEKNLAIEKNRCSFVGSLKKQNYTNKDGVEVENFIASTSDIEFNGKGEYTGNGNGKQPEIKTAQTRIVKPKQATSWEPEAVTGWND